MKLVTFTNGGAPRVGVLIDDDTRVVDLAAADDQPYFATMLDVIEAGDTAVGQARDIAAAASDATSIPLAEVTLKTPVLLPISVSGAIPPYSNASHATSKSSRCCGSMCFASLGVMTKNSHARKASLRCTKAL